MIFVKSCSTESEYGPWGSNGITVHLDISCDTDKQARDFIEDAKYSQAHALRKVVPTRTRASVLVCPKCFKSTKLCNQFNVTEIGIGDDVIGGCAYCDNIFMGTIHGNEKD